MSSAARVAARPSPTFARQSQSRYIQLTQIESVFRSLKSDLGLRPIRHQLKHRADAHILVAFLAYCLQVTLKNRLMLHAPGLTPSVRIPMMSISHSDLMPIRSERSDAGHFQCETVIGISQDFSLFSLT